MPDRAETSRTVPALCALALSPLFLVTAGLVLKAIRGPAWLGDNSDPEYLYLFNSLVVLRGHAPWHVDNPGTPLQMLGALVVGAVFGATGHGTLDADVAARSEIYINAVHVAVLIVAALIVLGAGVVVRRRLGLVPALLVQWAPWVSTAVVDELSRVRPEPLLIATGVALAATLAVHMDDGDARPAFLRLAGAWAGVSVALKLTAVPLLAAPLLIARGWKARRTFLLSVVVAFLIGIAAALRRLPSMAAWTVRLAVHAGAYGKGPVTVIDPAGFLPALGAQIAREPIVAAMLALSVATWWLWRHDAAGGEAGVRRTLGAVCVVQALQFLLMAKQASPSYITPAVALAGVNAVALGRYWRTRRAAAFAPAAAMAVLAVLILQTAAVGVRARGLAERRVWQTSIAEAVEAIRVRDHCVVVYHYRASAMPYALMFGGMSAEFAGVDVAPVLKARYPDAWFDRGRNEVVGFDWKGPRGIEALLPDHACVLVMGTDAGRSPAPPGLRLERLAVFGDESLARLVRE